MFGRTRPETIPILRTKLYPPRPSGQLVERAQLLATFDHYSERAVTLVCACAGYGKTTAIAAWLEKRQSTYAWVSLDAGDNDPTVFAAYLVAAMRGAFPEAGRKTLTLLGAPTLPSARALAGAVISDMETLAQQHAIKGTERFTLVLDDYHTIGNPNVHKLLGEVLRRLPQTVRIVLSARQDPPLPLHLLRSRGDLGEIRSADLRFSLEEAAAFTETALTTSLSENDFAILAEMTEGWIAGLRLAVIAVNSGRAIVSPHALDFLRKEALAPAPAAAQRFLIKTSVLDRLCGPLCDALVDFGETSWHGDAQLTWLAENNLFTFASDSEGKWFRYHPLFREMLRRELARHASTEEIAQLRSRAAAWFEQQGLLEEALQNSLAAGDESAAVRLIEAHRHEAINQENWQQLERWLGMLPARSSETRPELLAVKAWLLERQWRHADLASLLDRIEILNGEAVADDPHGRGLSGEIKALRGVVEHYQLEFVNSSESARQALELLPAQRSFARGLAWRHLSGAALAAGDCETAQHILLRGLEEDHLHGNAFVAPVYEGLCALAWSSADMPQLKLLATQMLETARERNLAEMAAFANLFLGCAAYQMNDLDAAELFFGSAAVDRNLTNGHIYTQGLLGLAAIYLARGETARAQAYLEAAASYGADTANEEISFDTKLVRLWLLYGDAGPSEDQTWLDSYEREAPLVPRAGFLYAHVLAARMLIASNSPARRAKARRILDRLREQAEPYGARYLIEVLALEALLGEAEGNRQFALETLSQAVALAEPGRLIRVFVDLGPKMAALLRLLLAASGRNGLRASQAFAALVLATFVDEPRPHSVPDQSGLIEPLTHREIEVLDLLRQRLMHKEIGEKLGISPMTVKRYASNLYAKLGVGNRREAVARSDSLGLFHPNGTGRDPAQTGH